MLRSDTLDALAEFLREKPLVGENWQLSQFFYSVETCVDLSEQVTMHGGRVALLCCPSLFSYMDCHLFEIDRRFTSDTFVYYDYNRPRDIPTELHHSFDFLVIDPPFLSEECFLKVKETVELLRKDSTRLMFNSGLVMERRILDSFGCRRTRYRPQHQNNLANDFACYTNYESTGEFVWERPLLK